MTSEKQEDVWEVITDLRRRLYIAEVMRELYRGRLEDSLSPFVADRCTDPCADPLCPAHGDDPSTAVTDPDEDVV